MSFSSKFLTNKIGTASLAALVFLIAIQAIFFIELRKAQEQAQDRVVKTHDTINVIEEVFTKIKNIELLQYDYLLSGNEKLLKANPDNVAPFGEEMATLLSHERRSIHNGLNKLEILTQDNTVQKAQIVQLNLSINNKLNFIEETINLSKKNKLSTRQSIDRISQGKQLMRVIRANVAQMILTEKKILFIREVEDIKTSNHLTYGIMAAVLMSYGLLLFTLLVIKISYARIAKAEEELHEKDIYFKHAVQGSTDAFFLIRAVDADFSNLKSLVVDYLNPTAESMTGYRASKAANQSIEKVFPRSNKIEMTNVVGYYNGIREKNKPALSDYTISEGPWKGRHVQEQITPLPNGMAISIRDISKTKPEEITSAKSLSNSP